jgi:hypothetical protein
MLEMASEFPEPGGSAARHDRYVSCSKGTIAAILPRGICTVLYKTFSLSTGCGVLGL